MDNTRFLAWLAGAVEGDGSLGLNPASLRLKQRYIDICAFALHWSGKGRIVRTHDANPDDGRPYEAFEWQVTAQSDIKQILNKIRDMLVTKRPEADMVLAWMDGTFEQRRDIERSFKTLRTSRSSYVGKSDHALPVSEAEASLVPRTGKTLKPDDAPDDDAMFGTDIPERVKWAWLAGFFDAEGSYHYQENKPDGRRKKHAVYPRLSVSQKFLDCLKICQRLTGQGYIRSKTEYQWVDPDGNPVWRRRGEAPPSDERRVKGTSFIWEVSNTPACVEIVKHMRPFAVSKYDQTFFLEAIGTGSRVPEQWFVIAPDYASTHGSQNSPPPDLEEHTEEDDDEDSEEEPRAPPEEEEEEIPLLRRSRHV